jgi:hypothetical protein
LQQQAAQELELQCLAELDASFLILSQTALRLSIQHLIASIDSERSILRPPNFFSVAQLRVQEKSQASKIFSLLTKL